MTINTPLTSLLDFVCMCHEIGVQQAGDNLTHIPTADLKKKDTNKDQKSKTKVEITVTQKKEKQRGNY